MKKIFCAIGVALSVTLLLGCEVTGPRVDFKSPFTVDDRHHDNDRHDRDGHDGDHDKRDGDFCPPGQAKKGRC